MRVVETRISEEDARKLKGARELFRRAALSRERPADCLEFVMREEKTQAKIVCAPHQRVLLDFVLDHRRCVVRLPPEHAKTYTLNALTLWLLGQDPSFRGALVGADQGIPAKNIQVVRDYIESSLELRLVYPHLRKSQRLGDPWTQTAITIDRPRGIKDPSLIAVGINGGKIMGSRINWAVVDDLLNMENTATKEQRLKVLRWFDNSVLSRLLSGPDSRLVFSGTSWHPDDVGHVLQKMGYPTIEMDLLGGIDIHNADDWDHELLRPESLGSVRCRLRDRADHEPLWLSQDKVDEIRDAHLPSEFNRVYMNLCRDDAGAPCKQEYVDLCLENGRGLTLVGSYEGPNAVYTGVDLAIGLGEQHDETAFFTFMVEASGHRTILDVEIGQWSGPDIVKKVLDKHRRYNSIIAIENNATQGFIRQFALAEDVSAPIRAYTTGRTKAHPEHGVQGLFLEMSQGAWRIPCSRSGRVHPMVEKWINGCLEYVAAEAKHTSDVLMASFFARELAKKHGAKLPPRVRKAGEPAALPRPKHTGSIGAGILAR